MLEALGSIPSITGKGGGGGAGKEEEEEEEENVEL